ncbi:type III-B CRISPR module RAMP protein Cmr1 [Thermotoga sp. SG1]|uniref:type III-B CRISPR module RAMP protein Cmr1 n=1 Tax=Thermotoga sp. SG1 TaxID=126739 RepID=UPI001E3644F8|nr:type III-B CRISPR module RAMP protein Cmr1 [Thermotoga sp. SG1]
MEQIKCRIVTPMFSRGASYSFELSSQSIKGVLRFWFRAIAPTIIDIYTFEDTENLSDKEQKRWNNEKYKGLKYLESLIFGSQERKAPFGLEVRTYGEPKTLGTFVEKNNKKGYKVQICESLKSLRYFLYGLYDENNKAVYEYLPPEARFSIFLHTRDENIKQIILNLLWLVSTFSGFGAKTRKGFGEFEIIDPSLDRNDYIGAIENCKEAIREFVKKHNSKSNIRLRLQPTKFEEMPEFPNFADCMILKSPAKKVKNVIEALKEAANVYIELKKQLRYSDGDCVRHIKNHLVNSRKAKIHVPTAILGLPLQYQGKGFQGRKVVVFSSLKELKIDKGRIDKGRKASPLFISAHRKDEKNWELIFLLMRSNVTSEKDGSLIAEVIKDKESQDFEVKVFVKEKEDYEKVTSILKTQGFEELQGGYS